MTKGQAITLDVRSGIWTWDIQVGFDWDGDGSFEDIQRAFSTPGTAITEAASSWGKPPYNSTDYRKNQQKALGHRGVLQHTFNVTVPVSAATGTTRMRILCDGDGYAGGIPAFDMCGSIGYAGSMHDFGMQIVGNQTADRPVASLQGGTYKGDQVVTITSTTADASIYYTLDGSTPTESTGTLYTAPVNITGAEMATTTVVLKAIAVKAGLESSSVMSETYNIQKGWSVPGGSYCTKEDRYIITATTTGAQSELNYSQSSNPSKIYIDTKKEITAEAGSEFTLNVRSTAATKWDHAIVFVDWNRNFSFDDSGEQLFKVGKEAAGDEEVADFTRKISVPADAKVGTTRLRVQFTDAWHKKNEPGHSHSGDDDVDQGGVYDFVLNIVPQTPTGIEHVTTAEGTKKATEVYTIDGIRLQTSLDKLTKGVYIVDGKKVVIK